MKIGFIGAGNMGGAILKGVLTNNFLTSDQVLIFDVNSKIADKWEQEYHVMSAKSNADLAQNCDWIFLCVKPIFLCNVIDEIKPYLKNKKVVSIAAGWSIDMLTKQIGEPSVQLLRVMPNTPALVGEGVLALCEETTLGVSDQTWVQNLFSTLGVVQIIPERLIDAVIAVSGSSPAYVYIFIEAMSDAAVKLGMPRQMAIESAAQAVLGAAKMVLETELHPAVLKDQVCSPGGTTIEAVQALEEGGLRSTVIKAMVVCAKKNELMSNGGKQ